MPVGRWVNKDGREFSLRVSNDSLEVLAGSEEATEAETGALYSISLDAKDGILAHWTSDGADNVVLAIVSSDQTLYVLYPELGLMPLKQKTCRGAASRLQLLKRMNGEVVVSVLAGDSSGVSEVFALRDYGLEPVARLSHGQAFEAVDRNLYLAWSGTQGELHLSSAEYPSLPLYTFTFRRPEEEVNDIAVVAGDSGAARLVVRSSSAVYTFEIHPLHRGDDPDGL
ncbi:MAG: hypothetical protein HC902_03880 [Calothrix sp. SM1_5_4]|nr:hypothetical protein [Calothrix sp. SM1_5_4]